MCRFHVHTSSGVSSSFMPPSPFLSSSWNAIVTRRCRSALHLVGSQSSGSSSFCYSCCHEGLLRQQFRTIIKGGSRQGAEGFGDWRCASCGVVNFRRGNNTSPACFLCKMPHRASGSGAHGGGRIGNYNQGECAAVQQLNFRRQPATKMKPSPALESITPTKKVALRVSLSAKFGKEKISEPFVPHDESICLRSRHSKQHKLPLGSSACDEPNVLARRPGDWTCAGCGHYNYRQKFKRYCSMCNTPKPRFTDPTTLAHEKAKLWTSAIASSSFVKKFERKE